MNELTLIDTFSGIGGFSLAGDWAGFRTVCFSEVDPYASAVLRKHWPDVPNLGDITKADFGPYAGATVLTGGFPCQPWSVAGKRGGTEDDRYLWPAMLAAIQSTRPAWVVGENVIGFEDVGLELASSDLENAGYSVQPVIIPACAVGLPQIEGARIWIVGSSNGKRQKEGADWGRVFEKELLSEIGDAAPNPRQYFLCRGSTRVFYSPFSEVCGGDYGLPGELDRIKSLGNSIVPQIAFKILKAIAAIETGERST